jgi:hypothetical protein
MKTHVLEGEKMPAAQMSRVVHAGEEEKEEDTYVLSVVGQGGGRTHATPQVSVFVLLYQ